MTSSTSSLRRRKLGEITEDAEENVTGKDDPVPSEPQTHRRRESTHSRASEATAVPSQRDGEDASRKRSAPQFSSEVPEKSPDKPLPTVPRSRDGTRTNGVPRKQSLDQISTTESRKSTQSARPSFRDFDQMSMYRPKMKVGPRPSMDSNGRPRTAGSVGKSRDSSLVASLPAGVRSSRKSTAPKNQSQADTQSQPQTPSRPSTKPPPVPALLVPPPPINLDPTPKNGSTSPKSVVSLPASVGGASPEKQRLMRALQLRKEQMAKRAEDAEDKKNHVANGNEQRQAETQDGSQLPRITSEVPEKPDNDSTPDQPSLEESKTPDETSREEVPDVEHTSDEKKQVSPDPSTPDSAVDMADTNSNVGERALTCDDTKPSDNYTNGDLVTTAIPLSVDSTASVDRPNSKPDEQHAAHRDESDASDGFKDGQEQSFRESTTEIPDAGPQDQIKLTEIETYGERSDAETPTPRAIPHVTTRPEIKPQDQETPATQEAEDIKEPVESHQTESTISPSQHPREPDETPPATMETESEEPSTVNNNDTANQHHKASLKDRRRGILDPIRVPTHPESSDEDNLLSDDSFMEELGSARVQEARPVALPKPGTSDNDGSSIGSRVVSSPTGGDSDVQALPGGRSASGSISSMVPRKVNVSSGISKRIKALEMFQSRESSPNPQPTPPSASASASVSRSSSQFDKIRKRASLSQTSLPPASDLNQKYSPETECIQRPPLTRKSSAHTHKSRNMSSVSVTARIVRDQPASSEPPSGPPVQPTINLQPSELTVQHDSQEEPSSTSTSTVIKSDNPRLSTSNPQSPRNSMTGHLPRSESVPSRLSLSSASRDERTLSNSSGEQVIEESRDDKKESRTSRMIRRMSSITSSSRRSVKSALSPSVKEEEPAIQSETTPEQKMDSIAPDPPQVVDIGEVNVQFPDTLLWKRRFMRVDEQGYLVLTPNTNEGASRNMVKRYHFSGLQTPCLPDQDREELPNSIVLDFLDGNTLQCACESRQGQNAVLQS